MRLLRPGFGLETGLESCLHRLLEMHNQCEVLEQVELRLIRSSLREYYPGLTWSSSNQHVKELAVRTLSSKKSNTGSLDRQSLSLMGMLLERLARLSTERFIALMCYLALLCFVLFCFDTFYRLIAADIHYAPLFSDSQSLFFSLASRGSLA